MRDYWDAAALDQDVDVKYICDVPVEDCLVDLAGLNGGGAILELGCGVGRLMKDGYCGVDISSNMLQIARARKPKCEFRLCEGSDIPYPDRSFDSVYCYLVFQHLKWPVISAYVSEVSRILQDGGLFIFQFIEGHESEPLSNHYSRDSLAKLLNDSGFGTVMFTESVAHFQWTICSAVLTS